MSNNKLAFTKKNYILMLSGIALLAVGFLVMTMETAPYGIGTLGVTVGPIILLSGFVLEFFAIMYKDKSNDAH